MDEKQLLWLYHHTADATFQYSVQEYRGATVAEMDKGPVLVTFREPARKRGDKKKRRKVDSSTAKTLGMQRVCIPFSYIERAVHHCHTGGLGGTNHTGQVLTWGKVNDTYTGISREIVRKFVQKCPVCQQKVTRVHKAALIPITAKTLFERVQVDLIDFTRKPSCGYHYILQAVDHYSKFHWAWALKNKEAATVAYHLNCLLAETGPIRFVQCDQGTEFKADCLQVLADFSCKMVNSSPYHPQTNGLVERGNSVLKMALHHWFVQEGTQDWFPPLARIRYQLNCNKPRTTKFTPYELVYGIKPPSWDGLNVQLPLHADTLSRVLNNEPPPSASADAALSPVADILTSMSSGQSDDGALRPSKPPAKSHVRLQKSHMRAEKTHVRPRKTQLPAPQSQPLPSKSTPIPPKSKQRPPPPSTTPVEPPPSRANIAFDLPTGVTGPIDKTMADELNIGCEFVRLGGEGGGRCALSAFYNALSPMEYLPMTSTDRLKRYDARRNELYAMWSKLNQDQSPASNKERRDLRDLVASVPFAGDDHNYGDTAPHKSLDLLTDERRERAWKELGAHLGHPTTSLGVEVIALLAHLHRVNVLLYISHSLTTGFGKKTKGAVQRWRGDKQQIDAQNRARDNQSQGPGNENCGWCDVSTGTTRYLVPDFVVQDQPWMVLFQRTTSEIAIRRDGDTDITTVTPASGHYEAVVKETITDGVKRYAGTYRMGDDTAVEYDRVLQIAVRMQAYHNSQAAQHRTCVDYDAKVRPRVFRHLDAVGLRVPTKNKRKSGTPHVVPSMVVDIHQMEMKTTTRTVVHQLYTVWSPQGLISGQHKVDQIIELSINNFPELLEFRDDVLTAEHRLGTDEHGWRSPMDMLDGLKPVTVHQAWAMLNASRKQRTVDMSRQRVVPARVAADAAATSIAAGEADRRAALSLNTISNRAVPSKHASSSSASFIVRILHENTRQYRVQWSQPEADPAMTWESKHRMDTQSEHFDVVKAWRHKQEEQKELESDAREEAPTYTDDEVEDSDDEAEHDAEEPSSVQSE